MTKHKNKSRWGSPVLALLVGLVGLGSLIAVLLQGNNVALFHPKGIIAAQQLDLMLLAVGIMLVIAIPTIFILYFFAWKYRESNTKAKHAPNARGGKLFNAAIWGVPAAFALVLAVIMWGATHRLEPQKQIAANAEPLTIQVIAQRWKWVFIYPEQGIATVNYVQIPQDTPVTFELTADEAPMSSFWIPNLGGMLYAMNGHLNKLNLLAEEPGDYPGSSAEINGAGFADMKFTARVSSKADFDGWVQGVQQQAAVLDAQEYEKLLKPSENHPPASYSSVERDLYATVRMKYMGTGHDHQPAAHHGGHE